MECWYAKKLITGYLKGTLGKEHCAVLKGHLINCLVCKRIFRKKKFKKYVLKGIISLSIVAIPLVMIVYTPHKVDIDLEEGEKKVVSNIIIEVLYKDEASDLSVVKDFVNSFGGEIVKEDPLSVKLEKHKVGKFVKGLHEFLIFSEDADHQISTFIQPLAELDEIVIKIKFLEKAGETG